MYFSDNVITYRRTEDLGIVWSNPIDQGLRAFPMAVSAHGEYVAAVMAEVSFQGEFERYTRLYTGIFDGKTGGEVARLMVFGKYGIAISPSGKLIATVTDELGDHGAILPTVHIHGVPSGARFVSVVHDRVPKGRRQALLAGCGVAFTSDGKYLVTSGAVTKVWSVGWM